MLDWLLFLQCYSSDLYNAASRVRCQWRWLIDQEWCVTASINLMLHLFPIIISSEGEAPHILLHWMQKVQHSLHSAVMSLQCDYWVWIKMKVAEFCTTCNQCHRARTQFFTCYSNCMSHFSSSFTEVFIYSQSHYRYHAAKSLLNLHHNWRKKIKWNL